MHPAPMPMHPTHVHASIRMLVFAAAPQGGYTHKTTNQLNHTTCKSPTAITTSLYALQAFYVLVVHQTSTHRSDCSRKVDQPLNINGYGWWQDPKVGKCDE